MRKGKLSERDGLAERFVGGLYAAQLPGLKMKREGAFQGSPDKPRGLSIQPCKSEKEEPYIRHSSQGRSECLYLRIE